MNSRLLGCETDNTASHPRGTESSVTVMWGLQVVHNTRLLCLQLLLHDVCGWLMPYSLCLKCFCATTCQFRSYEWVQMQWQHHPFFSDLCPSTLISCSVSFGTDGNPQPTDELSKCSTNILRWFIGSYIFWGGPDSSVGIATRHGLDGPGIQSQWGRDFPHLLIQTGPGAHPASCTMGTGSFPGVKSGRGVTLTPHPLLVPWSWKSRAIPLLPVWAVRPVQSLSACTRVHFTLSSSLSLSVGRVAQSV
jgi:hypothetical protein